MQSYDNMQFMPNMLPCMMQNQYMMPQMRPEMMMPEQYGMPQVQGGMEVLTPFTYPQNVPEALKLIQDAVSGETEDRMFYQYLIDKAPSEENKKIIMDIRDDEIKHFNLFRIIFYQLTGQTLPPPKNIEFEKPASYCDGIKGALLGEQNAVKKYRRILFALQDRVQINILTEIITDEIRHGILYNYLYSMNGCRI